MHITLQFLPYTWLRCSYPKWQTFLQMFVSKIEAPESIKSKTISRSANMQIMKEIIFDLGLEIG
jgi:hypothetical protein